LFTAGPQHCVTPFHQSRRYSEPYSLPSSYTHVCAATVAQEKLLPAYTFSSTQRAPTHYSNYTTSTPLQESSQLQDNLGITSSDRELHSIGAYSTEQLSETIGKAKDKHVLDEFASFVEGLAENQQNFHMHSSISGSDCAFPQAASTPVTSFHLASPEFHFEQPMHRQHLDSVFDYGTPHLAFPNPELPSSPNIFLPATTTYEDFSLEHIEPSFGELSYPSSYNLALPPTTSCHDVAKSQLDVEQKEFELGLSDAKIVSEAPIICHESKTVAGATILEKLGVVIKLSPKSLKEVFPEEPTSSHQIKKAFSDDPTSSHKLKKVFSNETTSSHQPKKVFPEETTSFHQMKNVFPEETTSSHQTKQVFPEDLTSSHQGKSVFPEKPTSSHQTKNVFPEEPASSHQMKNVFREKPASSYRMKKVFPKKSACSGQTKQQKSRKHITSSHRQYRFCRADELSRHMRMHTGKVNDIVFFHFYFYLFTVFLFSWPRC